MAQKNAEKNKVADKVKSFISVELSMGQMIEDVRLAIKDSVPVG